MRLVSFASVSILLASCLPEASVASTLVQTQLEGVKGAFVLSAVSQYLPTDVQALEPELKSMAEGVLSKAV